MYTGWEKSKANTFSLCEEGGETGYTAQEDLKSVNSYNMGEERTISVWFLHSCIPRPSLVLSALLPLGHHSYYSFSFFLLFFIFLFFFS